MLLLKAMPLQKRQIWEAGWFQPSAGGCAETHLCTKLQVPSMGSTIHVGLGVSTHLAPAAAASSAMNLKWAELSMRKCQGPETKRFQAQAVGGGTDVVRGSRRASLGPTGAASGKDLVLLSASRSLSRTRAHTVTPQGGGQRKCSVKAPRMQRARQGSEDGGGKG